MADDELVSAVRKEEEVVNRRRGREDERGRPKSQRVDLSYQRQQCVREGAEPSIPGGHVVPWSRMAGANHALDISSPKA